MPDAEVPQLAGPEPFQTVGDAPTVRLGHEALRIRERRQGGHQGAAVPIAVEVDAAGSGDVGEDVLRQDGQDLFDRVGRARSSGGIERLPGRLKVAEARSHIRRSVAPQDFDRPLDFPELIRVTASIRVESTYARPIRGFDSGL